MLLPPLIVLIALGLPYLLCAFFEWQVHPADWGWYTRAMLALVYAFYGWVVLSLLGDMRKRYVNRKA